MTSREAPLAGDRQLQLQLITCNACIRRWQGGSGDEDGAYSVKVSALKTKNISSYMEQAAFDKMPLSTH